MSTLQGDPRGQLTDDEREFNTDLAYLTDLLDAIQLELLFRGGTIPPMPEGPPTPPWDAPAAPRPQWLDEPPRKRWRWLGPWWIWVWAAVFIVVAAVWFSNPARADSTDDAFLDVISAQGIGYASASSAIGAGHLVCASMYSGITLPALVDEVQSESGLSRPQAAYFVGASIAAYCPDRMPGRAA